MKRVLGRKQTSDNATWVHALEHIEEYVARQEVEAYANWAVERIREAVEGRNAAYAWSAERTALFWAIFVGGQDSNVDSLHTQIWTILSSFAGVWNTSLRASSRCTLGTIWIGWRSIRT